MNSSTIPAIKCEEAAPTILLTDCDSGGTVLGQKSMVESDNATSTYNLNVNVNLSAPNGAVSSLLAAESACSTPRTPEILNSLIAMTNPMDQYAFNGSDKCASAGYKSGSCNDSNSSLSNGSPATSPASGTPPSIQKTCSDLIKAGLKLSIESKRKMSGSECSDAGAASLGSVKRLKKEEVPSDEDYDSGHTGVSKSEGADLFGLLADDARRWDVSTPDDDDDDDDDHDIGLGLQLTPEDEERRRRRRERNKIAATKCRLKKRERTVNLVTESEILETQNLDLKTQLQELEVQRRQLLDMLSLHTPSCVKNTIASPSTPYNSIRPPYDSPGAGAGGGGYPAYDTTSPYIRPESANILASSYTCVAPPGDADPTLDGSYLQHQLLEEYHRPDSAPGPSELAYSTDGFLPKTANLLVIEQADAEYYDEVAYHLAQSQQCHNYGADAQPKINNQGLNNGCLA